MRRGYHCIRVSDEVFERLLKRDPDVNTAVARLVYTNLDLDEPLEAAAVLGFLSPRTFNAILWNRNIKTIRELLDHDQEWIGFIRGIGQKGIDEVQALRRHFKYNLRVKRRAEESLI